MSHTTLPFSTAGKCRQGACVTGKHYRFTLLTERILRMEYDPEGLFEDRPSQTVICRDLPVPEYRVKDSGACLEIDTRHYHLTYNYSLEEEFTPNNLIIDAKNGFTHYGGRWHFGAKVYGDPPRHHNLYGTARTLDRSNGPVELEYGLMNSAGHSFFDDSETALFGENGLFVSRRPGTVDVYYICCQRDYGEALKDFYRIAGRPPMLPRYALGNWWSRWYPYTEESYLALFDRFKKEDLPFTMAVLDMDWHITKVDPKYGGGWTGYTWNKEYFPDPAAFCKKLHEKGAHICLNLHPADGVQGFEDAYPVMAKANGVDPATDEPVIFDITDPVFIQSYFDHLMHPLEADGVDHWWIDWQQGRKCNVPGMDPLWLLNHYHYADSCRDGKRGLILSRYCGLGGHRYPAGFSGDTVVSWESLDFQAYFTLTATNAGFCFWSHDIGGFMRGVRDPELFVRWLQLGVFSPFLRLHSTRNDFASKEPWSFDPNYQSAIGQFLRLRHRLIPYLYTEAYRQHRELEPVIRPVYYSYPMEDRAYSEKNQYLFGSQLMVCPITAPADKATGMGSVKAWIPEGVWTDFFTGKTYRGHRVTILNRSIDRYPVLAKAGAIVPTAVHQAGSNLTTNPDTLEIFVFPGGDGQYTLYEDDGLANPCFTEFTYRNDRFTIRPQGDLQCIPPKRSYKLTFRGFRPFQVEDYPCSYDPSTRSVTVELPPMDGEITLTLPHTEIAGVEDAVDRVYEFLQFAQLDTGLKKSIDTMVRSGRDSQSILEELYADSNDRRLMEVLTELLT